MINEKFRFDKLHENGWFKSAAAVVAFLVSVIALMNALGSKEQAQPTPQEISAPLLEDAQVVDATQRGLDSVYKRRIMQGLPNKAMVITIVCARQDSESEKFAREIFAFMQQRGYGSVTLAFTSLEPSFRGFEIEIQNNRGFIKVGPQS